MFKLSWMPFSTPFATDGYNDQSVSDETITEAYQHFVKMTRQRESKDVCKLLSGVCWDQFHLCGMALICGAYSR
jgi:hypothetical protein